MSETAIDINSLQRSAGENWRRCESCHQRYWGHHTCPGDERSNDDYDNYDDEPGHPYACRSCGGTEYSVERREISRARNEIDHDGYLPMQFHHAETVEGEVYCTHCGEETDLNYDEV